MSSREKDRKRGGGKGCYRYEEGEREREMKAMCVAVVAVGCGATSVVGAGGDNYRGVRRSMEQWRHGARDAASPWWPPTDPATLSLSSRKYITYYYVRPERDQRAWNFIKFHLPVACLLSLSLPPPLPLFSLPFPLVDLADDAEGRLSRFTSRGKAWRRDENRKIRNVHEEE